jgi:hypothetical protein
MARCPSRRGVPPARSTSLEPSKGWRPEAGDLGMRAGCRGLDGARWRSERSADCVCATGTAGRTRWHSVAVPGRPGRGRSQGVQLGFWSRRRDLAVHLDTGPTSARPLARGAMGRRSAGRGAVDASVKNVESADPAGDLAQLDGEERGTGRHVRRLSRRLSCLVFRCHGRTIAPTRKHLPVLAAGLVGRAHRPRGFGLTGARGPPARRCRAASPCGRAGRGAARESAPRPGRARRRRSR